MKVALCTTTIHVPHALKLLRKCNADVKFFVACDRNTPDEAYEFILSMDHNTSICLPESGHQYKCSEAIGWNTLARRNIAFLEALKWGAEVIVSWDNDNIPVAPDYFNRFAWAIQHPFYGPKASGADGWFDPGFLLDPRTKHRGFPHDRSRMVTIDSITDAKIGVAAGLVIGDPDIDAVTRMATAPDIQSVTQLGQSGIVVDMKSWTVFNSQNTAMIRELIPAWFMMPGVGRMDDIYASLIVQRVARERGYHVHFGQPLTYQQRNQHNPVTDLRAEIDGYENVTRIAAALDAFRLMKGCSVVQHTRGLYMRLASENLIPDRAFVAAMAWLEDCESLG